MTTDELLAMKLELNERSTKSSQALADYCKPYKGAMGLTSDECRQSEKYKQLKQQFDTSAIEALWYGLTPSERDSQDGIIKGVFNFLKAYEV